MVALDPLEWIHRIAYISDPGRHGRRFYGAYSNRARVTTPSAAGDHVGCAADARTGKDNSDFSREARSTWARLLRKIFEADPLLCACGARMRIVSEISAAGAFDVYSVNIYDFEVKAAASSGGRSKSRSRSCRANRT